MDVLMRWYYASTKPTAAAFTSKDEHPLAHAASKAVVDAVARHASLLHTTNLSFADQSVVCH
jgi:hypothetical protein